MSDTYDHDKERVWKRVDANLMEQLYMAASELKVGSTGGISWVVVAYNAIKEHRERGEC